MNPYIYICSIYWNELEMHFNLVCFLILFHDPLQCKKINCNLMGQNDVKCVKITLFILASMGLHGEIFPEI